MKLRPYLRSFVSSQVSIEEKNKSKPNPEHNNSIRRKKSADRRLGLKDIGSLQEGMEDRTEAPDKHSECQRNDNKMECVATPSGNIASGNSGQYQLVESQACSVIYTAPSIEDVKNFDEDLSNMETSTSPSRRRRFLSGNHLSPHTAESSHFLPHSADSGNGDYQLRRNSTMQTNIRHRSGSFNPTILTQHKMDCQDNLDSYSGGRERSLTSDCTLQLRHQRNASAVFLNAGLPRDKSQRVSRNRGSKSFADEDDDFEDDWSDFNSLESLDEGDLEEIQVFLPTGLLIDVSVHPDEEIFFVKQIVMNTATTNERLPLRGCLNPDAQCYVVSYISASKGILEEVTDESKTLRELKPFKNILKFSKRTRNRGQYHHLKEKVGKLICKDMKHFDEIRNVEVNEFRWRMKVFANDIAQERKLRLRASWQDRILYQYPPRLVCRAKGAEPVTDLIRLKVIWNSYQEETEIASSTTPLQLIMMMGPKCQVAKENCSNYCAKAIGEETYFVGDTQELISYAYIYNRVMTNEIIRLVIVNFENVDIVKASDGVYVLLDNDVTISSPTSPSVLPPGTTPSLHSMTSTTPHMLSMSSMSIASSLATAKSSLSSSSLNGSVQAVSSFDIEKPFIVSVESVKIAAEFILPGTQRTIGIQMGLFHGSKPLCPTISHILKGSSDESGVYGVDKNFEFDLSICNLPRMAKLCIGMYEKKRNAQQPLFWVNTSVFDYKAKLKWKDTLHLWNCSLDMTPTYGCLSPLRHTISNPNIGDATDIVISFKTREELCGKIFYPAESQNSGDSFDCDSGPVSPTVLKNGSSIPVKEGTISKLYTQELIQIAYRDPLHDITIQEKDLLWKVREHCLNRLPHLLPRIIDCVDYARPDEVLELHRLIERWPLMPLENSLQLLDYAYPDPVVRGYAVRCLRKAKDSVILMYLLQLAQALKHENYLQCDLVDFLLERALNNQHIGHFLFWELRAEMNSLSVGLMYGLVMEAYLLAAPEHLKILEHQVTLLEKCQATYSSGMTSTSSSSESVLPKNKNGDSASLKKTKNEIDTLSPKNKHKIFDHETENVGGSQKSKKRLSLESQFYGHRPFKDVVNPLKPSQKCHSLQLDKCRRMHSKKRPQVLSFENADFHISGDLDDIVIMFKKGDDLRQDRLTLQLLSVMDNIWKETGLDLRMNVYGVMATGLKEGFIEVVQQAETICKIQLSQTEYKSTAVFRKGLLLSWLRYHNPTPEKMQQAQWEFTQSCAGYTVAAYVLGIGDRHNDNIMVKRNGQMFHIDFGHFLGNFKHKFGIKRERVRLVLSSDFVEVIKADLGGQKKNFERFRDLCEKAYLTIRRHGCLVISLLAMMISTGLPELSSEQDLNTIRTTLHLDRSEEDAMDRFRKDFDESLKNAWTISIDWWFHSINQLRIKTDRKTS